MKYLYMDEQERQIQYYQFLKFLLELPAKIDGVRE